MKKERRQLNLRLDSEGDLLDKVKQTAKEQQKSVNQFVVDALRLALGESILSTRQPLDNTLDRVDNLEKKLESLALEFELLKARQKSDPVLNTVLDIKLDNSEPDLSNQVQTTYTDKELAQELGLSTRLITKLRRRQQEPADSTFWDYWQPIENRALWQKLKPNS